jgi:uncharacterized cupredoxin-like copper-binding protein
VKALVIGALVAAVALAGAAGIAAATSGASHPVGPGLATVDVGIQHSHFSTGTIHVRRGTLVRFVVHNDDPIAHELIVGDDAVHARHAHGTESAHPPVPGEVSVGADDTGLTVYEFDQPGQFLYACHLPGHFQYGMKGTVVVS